MIWFEIRAHQQGEKCHLKLLLVQSQLHSSDIVCINEAALTVLNSPDTVWVAVRIVKYIFRCNEQYHALVFTDL